MTAISESVIDQIIALRCSGATFTTVAERISSITGEMYTSDRVQKLYKKYGPKAEIERRRVVVIGDVHANPDDALTEEIVNAAPDLIVVGGDLLDMNSLNSHSKDTKGPALKTEFEICQGYLVSLLDRTPAEIILIEGNHEQRMARELSKTLPDKALDFALAHLAPLQIVAQGLGERVSLVSTDIPDYQSSTSFWGVVGDMLISHMDFTGKKAGDAARKLYAWYIEWRKSLSLPEISVLVQTHTHKLSLAFAEGGYVALIEPGMAGSKPAEKYKVCGQKTVWSPGPIGALYVEQERRGKQWCTAMNSIKLIYPIR